MLNVIENIIKGRDSANIFNVGKVAHQVARQEQKRKHKNYPFGGRGKENETGMLLK